MNLIIRVSKYMKQNVTELKQEKKIHIYSQIFQYSSLNNW